MKVKDAQFFTVVSSFLNVYLVKNRSCSSNTVKSYEDALNLLFTFLEGTKDIPRQRVSWSHFTRQNIQEFVDWLEKVRNCSRQTQLQRLAAIRSFVRAAISFKILILSPEKLSVMSFLLLFVFTYYSWLLFSINSSSFFMAAPLSISCSAIFTPASMEAALPAI